MRPLASCTRAKGLLNGIGSALVDANCMHGGFHSAYFGLCALTSTLRFWQVPEAGFRGWVGRSMGPFLGVRRLSLPDTGGRTRANGTDQHVQSTTPQEVGERSVSPVSSQPRPTTKKARDARVLHRLAAALLRLPPSRVELPKHCTRPSPRREQQPPATADRMTPAESCDYAIVAMLLLVVWKLMIAM